MLAGREGKTEIVLPVTNVDHSPYRFRMHPAEQVRSLMAIEAMGLELLAIYHSHPEGPAFLRVMQKAVNPGHFAGGSARRGRRPRPSDGGPGGNP
jgi:hypothetical protein